MNIYHPGTEIGQCRVLSSPMMGGMGVVYICHDLANDRAARDRFLRKGRVIVDISGHPSRLQRIAPQLA